MLFRRRLLLLVVASDAVGLPGNIRSEHGPEPGAPVAICQACRLQSVLCHSILLQARQAAALLVAVDVLPCKVSGSSNGNLTAVAPAPVQVGRSDKGAHMLRQPPPDPNTEFIPLSQQCVFDTCIDCCPASLQHSMSWGSVQQPLSGALRL